MRTLSIQEQDFSPDIAINEGVHKLSGRKAKRFIHQTALYLPLSCDEVYKHFQEKEYFNLPTPIITWIMITLLSPVFIFAITIISIICFINLLRNYCNLIITNKCKKSAKKKETIKPRPITANEYVYELLGLWTKEKVKHIEPFLSQSNL